MLVRDPACGRLYRHAAPVPRRHAVLAAEHGKHIILEKPMALTLAECDAIIAAVERHKVHLIVGHTHAFDPAVRLMREHHCSWRTGQARARSQLQLHELSLSSAPSRRARHLERRRNPVQPGAAPDRHRAAAGRRTVGACARAPPFSIPHVRPKRACGAAAIRRRRAASLVYSGYDHFDSDEWHFGITERGTPNSSPMAPPAARWEGAPMRRKRPHRDVRVRRDRRRSAAAPAAFRRHHRHLRRRRYARFRRWRHVYGREGVREIPIRAAPACPAAARCWTICGSRSAPGARRFTMAAGAGRRSRSRSRSCNRRGKAAKSRWNIRSRCRTDRDGAQTPVRNRVITTRIATCINPCAATA